MASAPAIIDHKGNRFEAQSIESVQVERFDGLKSGALIVGCVGGAGLAAAVLHHPPAGTGGWVVIRPTSLRGSSMTGALAQMCVSLIPVLSAILLVLASISSAQAQSAGSLAAAVRKVDVGEKVRVLRADGTELRGELTAIDPTPLAIDVDDHLVRIGAADVREIGVKDGVYNGILIGLGAGLPAGVVTGLLIMSPDDGNLRGLGVSLAAAAGLGTGIGIGAAMDAAAGHYRTIYGASPTVRVSPFVGPAAYGAAVAIVW